MFLSRLRTPAFFRSSEFRLRRLECCYSNSPASTGLTQDIEEILKVPREKDRSKLYRINTAGTTLISIAKKASDEDKINLQSDKRFSVIIKELEGDVQNTDPQFLISSLKAVKNLGLTDEDFVVKNLENALLWNARICPMKGLIMGFSYSVARQDTEQAKRLFQDICSILERRWVEIKDGKYFAILFQHIDKLDPQLLVKLEDRLQDSVEDMDVSSLVEVLKCYARNGVRRAPVLRSLSYYIAKNRGFLDITQIADVLFAYSKLSFRDQEMIERVCASLENLVSDNDNMAAIRSILTSLGHLKIVPGNILDLICDFYQHRLSKGEILESRDVSGFIITLANLDYTPLEKENLLKELESRLKYEDFVNLPHGHFRWLEVVWSLLVLNRPITDHLQTVLSPSFVKNLDDSHTNWNSLSKLLNLNCAAQALGSSYTGPKLSDEEVLHFAKMQAAPSKPKQAMRKLTMDTLSTLFPPPKFLQENVATKLGVTVDMEVITDANSKPLQIEPYATNINSEKPPKDLPAGASRLAILVTPFQECLLGGGMTGATSLAVRLLEQNGFVTLVINNQFLDPSMKMISRIQKFDVSIKTLLEKKKQ